MEFQIYMAKTPYKRVALYPLKFVYFLQCLIYLLPL